MSLRGTMLESLLTLKRPTIRRDRVQGVKQNPFTVIVADVPCSFQPASTADKMLYGQRNLFTNCTLYCVQDIGAAVNDIVEVVDQNGNTHTVQVVGFNSAVNMRFDAPYTINGVEVRPNRASQDA